MESTVIRTACWAGAITLGVSLNAGLALAKDPFVQQLSNGGYEVTWSNACFAQYNERGEALSYSENCNNNQAGKSNAALRSYMAAHNGNNNVNDGGAHGSEARGGRIVRLSNGKYLVSWKSDCTATFNKHGEAMSFSKGCNDSEIAKSYKMVRNY